MAKQGISRGFLGPHRLSIDGNGVMDVTPFCESRMFWSAIEEAVEGEDHVFLYTGTHAAFIIPRRAFVSDLAVGGFVEGMNDLIAAAIVSQGVTPLAGEARA